MSELPASLALALVENLADGVVVCEAAGAIRWMNSAMRRLLGLAEGDPMPTHRDALGLTLGKPWHIPNSLRNQSLFSLRARYVTLNETRVSSDDGGALRLLVLRDCTAQLAESWDSGNFLGTMSLGLRTQLTAIRGFSELLLRDRTSPLFIDHRELVEVIRGHAVRITHLINTVVLVGDLDMGNIVIERSDVELPALLASVCAQAWQTHEASGLPLIEAVPAELRPALADPDMLRRAVLLLLDNAYAFTERGEITVRATDLGDRVRVEVEDTGPGIPAEQHERAFERYGKNVHRGYAHGRRSGGLGLGLYICRELITRMGGAIWIEEAPGGGTCVVLTLLHAPAPADEGRA